MFFLRRAVLFRFAFYTYLQQMNQLRRIFRRQTRCAAIKIKLRKKYIFWTGAKRIRPVERMKHVSAADPKHIYIVMDSFSSSSFKNDGGQ